MTHLFSRPVACTAMSLLAATSAPAELVTSTWVGGPSGAWSVPTNWSPPVVPSNGGDSIYDVIIDGSTASAVSIGGLPLTVVAFITIGADDSLSIQPGQFLALNGGGLLWNDGLLTLDATAMFTSAGLTIATDMGFTGAGAVVGAPGPGSNSIGGANELVNGVNHSISGSLSLGGGQLKLKNQGLVNATGNPGITVNLADGVGLNFNTGTMRASNGSSLVLQDFTLDNSGGLIEAAAGSKVILFKGGTFDSLTITGGTIRDADGDGPGFVQGGGVTLQNLTIDGPFVVPDGAFINLGGTIQILSTLSVNDLDNGLPWATIVAVSSPFLFEGGGELVLSNSQFNRVHGQNSSTRLVNTPGFTIRGAGKLGFNVGAITNEGTIVADASQGLVIDVTDSMDFTNLGLLHAVAGDIVIQPGAFVNGGTVIVDAGHSATRLGQWTQTGGVTQVDGTIVLDGGGSMQLEGGTLSGVGSVTGGLVHNIGGTVAPGASAGTLLLGAGYDQGGGGTLDIEIGGPAAGMQHDLLAVAGDASLAGTLRISRVDGFVPDPGEMFTILTTTGTRSGTFDLIESCDDVIVTYSSDSVVVTVMVSPGDSGDLNHDGIVDGGDLGALLAGWGSCGGTCCVGDLNGDAMVDGADLGMLLGAWSS